MLFSHYLSQGRLFLIGEIGQNHNGDFDQAIRLIAQAVKAGFTAVKFTKRDIAWELTDEAYHKPYENPNSFGRTYGEHREFLELSEEDYHRLKAYCDEQNIIFFCTACDPPSVEMMERIGNPIYKIASRDLSNLPLLECVGRTGKDVIISTGMATYEDIDLALATLEPYGSNVAIMQCTSEYPTPLEHVNLNVIPTLKKRYGRPVGLSDHTAGVLTAALSVVLGAELIEKHITISRAMKGTDHAASLEFPGMQKLVDYATAARVSLGNSEKELIPEVKPFREKLERSLVARHNLPVGHVVSEEDLILKSPGTGLQWKERQRIVGKKALRSIEANTLLQPKDFA